MHERERPSPGVAAAMTVGIIGFWVLGYAATKNLRVEDIFDPPKRAVTEVLALLDQYSNMTCIPRNCTFAEGRPVLPKLSD